MDAFARERYSRQIFFHGLGERGQERLLAAHAAIVGCGALGSFHAASLARAGVGSLALIDRDYVEPSNLQRQWLYDEADAEGAMPKAAAAERALRRINSSIAVRGLVRDLDASSADELLEGAGAILDGTDNFAARFLINDYAVSRGVPWLYGAAVGSYGLAMPVIPGRTACLRCIYPEPPSGAQPTCETAGVLGAVVSAVASLQAADALKILSGNADRVRPVITTVEIWEGRIRQIDMPPPDPNCPACGRREFPYLEAPPRPAVELCGRNAFQINEGPRQVDLEELRRRLDPLGEVKANQWALRFRQPPYEMTVFPDGRAIVKGTAEPGAARSFYARCLGL